MWIVDANGGRYPPSPKAARALQSVLDNLAGDPGTMAHKQLSSEELELLRRLRRGDPRAQATLVCKYQSALLYCALRVVHDRALAEDIVQDGWLKAFSALDRFDGRSSLFTWICQIVLNTARNRRRKTRHLIPFSSLCPARSRSGSGGTDDPELPDGMVEELTPERVLLEQEAARAFDSALRALTEAQRSVVILRDLKGASSVEACRVLQISDLTQRVRLSRGRARLRQALQHGRPFAA